MPEQLKRWVVVAPATSESRLLLAQASTPEQQSRIGNQTGGRVFLFLYTDNFWRDYELYRSRGIEFIREHPAGSYGTVAVFKDLYGNLWDLLEPRANISEELTAMKESHGGHFEGFQVGLYLCKVTPCSPCHHLHLIFLRSYPGRTDSR